MVERLTLAMAIITLGLGAYYAGTRWQVARVNTLAQNHSILPGLKPGTPAILYFWSDNCAPCRLVQRPAIEAVQAQSGAGLQVIMVNAVDQPDLAAEWGVMSLPTTFIIDAAGRVAHVNHGVARVDQLLRQLGLPLN